MTTFPELMDDPLGSTIDEALERDATRRRSIMPAGAIGGGALERQVGGGHYKGMAIQPIEFSMLNGLNACQHTAIKYIVRRKGDRLEDIAKAIHTLEIYRDMIAAGQAE